MSYFAGPIAYLINELHKLPGIGPKSAQRLAFYILQLPVDEARRLAEAILMAREKVSYCSICYNLTDRDPCLICQDEARDSSLLCVVEQPRDITAIEKTRGYRGLYHVLQGAISPMDGIGPEQLRIRELLNRINQGQVKEVILGTNLNTEGDVTAMYLARLLKPLGIRVTRLAHGLPVGGDLEYADELTLGKSLEGRREM
ncbi:MAG: recombination mediator RecR [Bacillota bacterium]|jgi:recombination protein RecR